MTKDELLDIVYREHKAEPFLSHREFECMIAIVEDGTVNTLEELQKYGFGEEQK